MPITSLKDAFGRMGDTTSPMVRPFAEIATLGLNRPSLEQILSEPQPESVNKFSLLIFMLTRSTTNGET